MPKDLVDGVDKVAVAAGGHQQGGARVHLLVRLSSSDPLYGGLFHDVQAEDVQAPDRAKQCHPLERRCGVP
jgi:hypothetical protein